MAMVHPRQVSFLLSSNLTASFFLAGLCSMRVASSTSTQRVSSSMAPPPLAPSARRPRVRWHHRHLTVPSHHRQSHHPLTSSIVTVTNSPNSPQPNSILVRYCAPPALIHRAPPPHHPRLCHHLSTSVVVISSPLSRLSSMSPNLNSCWCRTPTVQGGRLKWAGPHHVAR
jgi:hypothetical protein